jgi:hypothetical protein
MQSSDVKHPMKDKEGTGIACALPQRNSQAVATAESGTAKARSPADWK